MISVVIPAYNEEGNIKLLHEKLTTVLGPLGPFEILFVDDGSTDETLAQIKSLADSYPNVHYLSFSRNFGHQNALKAGLDHATGDCVISMDADMQHPAESIPEMIRLWKDGAEIVYTIRMESDSTGVFKRTSSSLFYKLINSFSDIAIHENAADFRLLDKKVIDVIRTLPENDPFMRGLISWIGFRQIAVPYLVQQRHSGTTKYSIRKMWNFAISGITSFSTKPLKISIYIGIAIALLSFIYAMYAIYISAVLHLAVAGWTSTIVSVLFIGGIQLIMIGVIGEYLGKLFMENKRRPNYIIRDKK